jgi:hypothetical protein
VEVEVAAQRLALAAGERWLGPFGGHRSIVASPVGMRAG